MKKPTPEELALGLDPNKYSQETFNPAKYAVGNSDPGLAREIEKMKQIKAQQTEVLGSPSEPTPEELLDIKKQMMQRMAGY